MSMGSMKGIEERKMTEMLVAGRLYGLGLWLGTGLILVLKVVVGSRC